MSGTPDHEPAYDVVTSSSSRPERRGIMETSQKRRFGLARKLAATLGLALMLGGAASPAFAEDWGHYRQDWRAHEAWRHEQWREHARFRPYQYAAPRPGYYYAPPPVTYAPPSLSFVFPIR